jgi:hypothetical protein
MNNDYGQLVVNAPRWLERCSARRNHAWGWSYHYSQRCDRQPFTESVDLAKHQSGFEAAPSSALVVVSGFLAELACCTELVHANLQ